MEGDTDPDLTPALSRQAMRLFRSENLDNLARSRTTSQICFLLQQDIGWAVSRTTFRELEANIVEQYRILQTKGIHATSYKK